MSNISKLNKKVNRDVRFNRIIKDLNEFYQEQIDVLLILLVKKGVSQSEIARAWRVSHKTVSLRFKTIRERTPYEL